MSRGQDAGKTGVDKKQLAGERPDPAAGNGLLGRRGLLGAADTGGVAGVIPRSGMVAGGQIVGDSWMRRLRSPFVDYGQPSRFEAKVVLVATTAPGTTGTGASRTPHHVLEG